MADMRRDLHKLKRTALPRVVAFEDDIKMLQKKCQESCPEAREIFRLLQTTKRADSVLSENASTASPERKEKAISTEDVWQSMTKDIVRLGMAIGLDLYHIMALILKWDWEQSHIQESETAPAKNMIYLLPQNASGLNREFKPDIDAIIHVLEKEPALADHPGFTRENLMVLIHEMIAANLHLLAIDSPETKAFAKRAGKAASFLQEASPLNEKTFLIAKTNWLQIHEELGNCLVLMERRRLKNAEIRRNWLELFGKEFLSLQEQTKRLEGLKLRLSLLESDPSLTEEQIEQLVKESEQDRAKYLRELELDILLAFTSPKTPKAGKMSQDKYVEFRQKYKQVLRRIWLMIHPDRLQHHPEYPRLTQGQIAQLEEMWHQIMKVRPEEVGFSREQLGYEYRELSWLEEIAATAETILSNAGIDTDQSLIIKGETIEEQIEWLRNAIARLEIELDHVKMELKAIIENRDIHEKRSIIDGTPKQQEKFKSEMIRMTQQYRVNSEDMEAELMEKLGKTRSDKHHDHL